jgi:pSer/pThr/pTyr-binding forkhead associated (FHA) protein
MGVPLGLAFPWGIVGVDPDGTLVGRSPDAGPLATHLEPYDNVSRRHARLWRARERLFVRDADSLNGTFVNNERLAAGAIRELRLGDVVRFGADLQARVVRRGPHERRGP